MFAAGAIFIYFISILIAISAMTLIVLVTGTEGVKRRNQLNFLMLFCVSNLLIATLYLILTVQDSLVHFYHYSTPVRMADISLYTVQAFSWCMYLLYFDPNQGQTVRHRKQHVFLKRSTGADVCKLSGSDERKSTQGNEPYHDAAGSGRGEWERRQKFLCTAVYLFVLTYGLIVYVFFVDDRFICINRFAEISEFIISALITIPIAYASVSRIGKMHRRTFMLTAAVLSVLIVITHWWTSIYMLLAARFQWIYEVQEYLIGSTLQMLIIGTLAVAVYRYDYSGKYLAERLSAKTGRTAEAAEETGAEAAGGSGAEVLKTMTAEATGESGTEAAELTGTEATETKYASLSGHRAAGSAKAAAIEEPVFDLEKYFDEKQLTKREREVAYLAYEGLTNPEIAERLCISQYTVKRHMHSIS
ncbi:MAG: helix-turn-helix transcriptional regulator [Eubacteriales bacterium]|nr:helix-turn-helix transcriptional regulator [Eubacteriales bacterium]